MSRGYVYILRNPCMPGLVKIGKTTRTVEARVAELYQTGVPTPFQIVHSVFAVDCSELEAAMHDLFSDRRVDFGREFFAVDESEARDSLDNQHNDQVTEWLDEYLPDHSAVLYEMQVDPGHINFVADQLGAHPFEIVSSIGDLTAEEIAPAYARWRAKVDARLKARQNKGSGAGDV